MNARTSDHELEKQFERLRQTMVVRQLSARDITDPAVLQVMGKILRHRFVPVELRDHAYDDAPQPIGYDQTISQPYVVASMTQHLRLRRPDRVLEIGTGSGYQTAVLAELCDNVWSIECVSELHERARLVLPDLGYDSVHLRLGNGLYGWPEEAPFDAIIVTAAAAALPSVLVDQLAIGGRMVIPIESAVHENQDLVFVEKLSGRLRQTHLYPVRFVPLTAN